MRRKTFDALLTIGGLGIAIVLLVGGGLLTWASTFVHNEVHTQLAAAAGLLPAQGQRCPRPG